METPEINSSQMGEKENPSLNKKKILFIIVAVGILVAGFFIQKYFFQKQKLSEIEIGRQKVEDFFNKTAQESPLTEEQRQAVSRELENASNTQNFSEEEMSANREKVMQNLNQ